MNNAKPAKHLKWEWAKIYQNWFNTKVDFADLIIPEIYDPKKHFGVILPKGVNWDQASMVARNNFDIDFYPKDFNKNVSVDKDDVPKNERIANNGNVFKNDRIADRNYVVIFAKSISADKKFRDISANNLVEMNISGITLLERLLLEIYYFYKTAKHLDLKTNTLCSGSRDAKGNIPTCGWEFTVKEFYVIWSEANECDDTTRSRAVIATTY